MSNYGYTNTTGGYSTTSYGAQGGAESGGFNRSGGFGGSQAAGSQDSPGGTRTYGKDTLRPVTVKQILDATQPHPDADFKIDGVDVTQITFVGQVHSISTQTTNSTYKIDDGTGLIEVKQWIDDGAVADELDPGPPQEGQYVHVWGRLKAFNNKRHVAAHIIRPVTDHNEVTYHGLEATYVHLYFTRGAPETLGSGGPALKNEDGLFVDNNGHSNGNGNSPAGQLREKIAATSANARKVYQTLLSEPQNNEGLNAQTIANKMGMDINDVYKAGDELLAIGCVYTTIDDETWAVLEC